MKSSLHIGLQGTSQTYFYNSQAEDITLFIVQFIDKIIHLYAIYINVCNIFATIVKVVRVSKSMVFKQGNFIGIQIFIDNKQIRRFKGIKSCTNFNHIIIILNPENFFISLFQI